MASLFTPTITYNPATDPHGSKANHCKQHTKYWFLANVYGGALQNDAPGSRLNFNFFFYLQLL